MMRPGGDQVIPRPPQVWVRPYNPWKHLDLSPLRDIDEVLSRVKTFSDTFTPLPPRPDVQVSAVLGKATMQVSQLLKLGRGAVVELDRKVGEAIDIYVNNRLIARGEVVVVDEHLGVTMTEIIKGDRA